MNGRPFTELWSFLKNSLGMHLSLRNSPSQLFIWIYVHTCACNQHSSTMTQNRAVRLCVQTQAHTIFHLCCGSTTASKRNYYCNYYCAELFCIFEMRNGIPHLLWVRKACYLPFLALRGHILGTLVCLSISLVLTIVKQCMEEQQSCNQIILY